MVAAEFYNALWAVPRPGTAYSTFATNLQNLLFFLVAALLLWYGARRLPRAYSWYALALLAYPLFFPSKYVPLMSYPRFTLDGVPALRGAGPVHEGPPAPAQGVRHRRDRAADRS